MVKAGRAGVAALLILMAAGAPAAAPKRVVSMNLCADQLAMMVAAPGQLVSVSWLAQDPASSAMAEEARAYPANHGRAEEVFMMRPDLVLAGSFTSRATVSILRRLGVQVEEFALASKLDEIPDRIAQMGASLGREAEAARLIAAFRSDLAEARREVEPRPRAALHYANSYTSGAGTLAGDIVAAAGLANIGAELGFEGMAQLSLELLVMAEPDLLIEERRYDAPALAEQRLDHPALAPVRANAGSVSVADPTWVCGTPATVGAVRHLAAVAAGLPVK